MSDRHPLLDKRCLNLDFDGLDAALSDRGMSAWLDDLPKRVVSRCAQGGHGDLDRWLAALDDLPTPEIIRTALDCDAVTAVGAEGSELGERITQSLQQLHPWRKGPFDLHGVRIDTEWRSDLKWRRLEPHIASLRGRAVLDIGCGNGYYQWRMLGAGARVVLGIDPTQLFAVQFAAVERLLGKVSTAFFLPLGIEDLPPESSAFDTVFSMGIFYHRRSPIEHLIALRDLLRPGGELVLETLVVAGGAGTVLVPPGRYAKMRNVWFLPSVIELESWLTKVGFRNVRAVDVTPTTVYEQRSTEWMRFESLSDFLDPLDPAKTVEGHPGPVRAIVLANTPGAA